MKVIVEINGWRKVVEIDPQELRRPYLEIGLEYPMCERGEFSRVMVYQTYDTEGKIYFKFPENCSETLCQSGVPKNNP